MQLLHKKNNTAKRYMAGQCAIGQIQPSLQPLRLLGVAITMVQRSNLALSRSLFSRMVPKSKSAEFFGFFSVSSKFAGIAGPFVFAVISQAKGGSRLNIVSLIFFFITGLIVLTSVDDKEGTKVVKAEESKLALSS